MNPSLLLIPDRYKAAKLYSQIPDSGAGDLTFARNSNATRVNSAGLIEKVRTNLLTYSQDFSNAAWDKSAGATLTHSETDPNGGTTASRLQLPSGTSNYLNNIVIGVTNGGKYTHSVYMKSNTGSTQSVRILDGVRGAAGGTLTASVTTSWQRFEVVITTDSTSAAIQIDNAGGAYNNDILIAFAQTEESDFGATPYIPTTTAAVSVGITADIPRLDYTGGGCPSLLLEPQRTNLALFSEQFNNAAWGKTRATITANTAVSPDGTTSADLYTDGTFTANAGFIDAGIVVSSGSTYTLSVFVKAATSPFVVVGLYDTQDNGVLFNTATNTTTSFGTINNVKVDSYSNNWYRVSFSRAVTDSTIYPNFSVRPTNSFTAYNGTASLSAQLWGAQLELGSYVSSYIPTLGSSVTRLADTASKTGISSLIGQTAGTVFIDVDIQDIVSIQRVLAIISSANPGTTTSEGYFYINSSTNLTFEFYTAGLAQAVINFGAVQAGRQKLAFAYANNDFVFYRNGSLVGSDNSGTIVGVLDRVFLGCYTNNALQANAEINSAALYPVRLSNAELASLTSL
jgi:hypothetical protein